MFYLTYNIINNGGLDTRMFEGESIQITWKVTIKVYMTWSSIVVTAIVIIAVFTSIATCIITIACKVIDD